MKPKHNIRGGWMMKKRVLISVANKENIVEFAKGLVALDYEIISTGGTLHLLQSADIPAQGVEDITGFPEMLDGRVKTLHPKIHGGLLAQRNNEDHQEQLEANQINLIDLVVVNLYPFKETLQTEGVSEAEIVENIDIGGPTMLRAAAKNYTDVAAVVDPSDYQHVLTALEQEQLNQLERQKLAAKVFRHTAHYDTMIAHYFTTQTEEFFPETYSVTYEKVQTLRYGENPHQKAAFYKDPLETSLSLASATQLHGKELSFNNIQDANAALEMVSEYEQPAVVAVKHMNPCGIALGDHISAAFTKVYEADPISIFGGIIACNREIDVDTAEQLSELFLEIVMAPAYTKAALDMLTKKKNIRLLVLNMDNKAEAYAKLTTVKGGVLIQNHDDGEVDTATLTYPTTRQPTTEEQTDLLFAWKAVKHVKSNAIVLAKNKQTIGIGAGQMNRIGAAKIAIEQANDKCAGGVLASDAFIPIPDTIEAAAEAGITAIIQPGGSKRDQDSIDACNEHGIAMIFTDMRHFKH